MSTYERCGHECPSEQAEAARKCPVCKKRVSYVRSTSEIPVFLPDKEQRDIERR